MPVTDQEKLEFVPQDPIGWLSPGTLVPAALGVGLSTTFGRFADKRELFAGIQQVAKDREPGKRQSAKPPPYFDYSKLHDGKDLWFDYLSDTGDGFNATYTMAWLLAQASLRVPGLPEDGEELLAGEILLLGGDQVYPAPGEDEYDHRFFGPFRAALPEPVKEQHRGRVEERHRDLYALPGNHDWYDGLTAFTRRFCNPGPFSGYYGRQTRSYWALRLPRNWWVWAIDIQLDTYIDTPQIEYFKGVGELIEKERAKERERVERPPKHKLILLTAKPSWVKPDLEPASWRNLTFFEQRVVEEKDVRIALVLTGDLHHYSRYQPDRRADGPVRLTAGGGGAYMSSTHTLRPDPEPKRLPRYGRPASEGTRLTYRRMETYPTLEESRPMAKGVFKLPFKSPFFCLLLSGIYALLGAAILRAAGRSGGGLVGDVTEAGFLEYVVRAGSVTTVAIALLLFAGLAFYAEFRKADDGDGDPHTLWGAKAGVGFAHALAHVAIVVGLVYAAAAIYSGGALGLFVWLTALAFCVIAGYLGGSLIFALVLYLIHRGRGADSPKTANTVFAGQGIEDYKNFLRLHLDGDGALTVYALGVDRVCREWKALDQGADPQVIPADRDLEPAVRLIDEVIRFDPSGGRLT